MTETAENQGAPRPSFQPGRLWSLWEMLQTKIGRLLDINERLIVERGNFERAQKELRKGPLDVVQIPRKTFVLMGEQLTELLQIITAGGLQTTAIAVDRYLEVLKGVPIEENAILALDARVCGNHFHHLMDITSRIRDECDTKLFYQITSKNAALLADDNTPRFGKDVFDAFPLSDEDLTEAGRCLALGRNTACVFHLMRAMEEALRALAGKIGVSVLDKNGQFERWGVLVGNLKAKIPALPPDQQDDWTEAHNLLWGVNRVWRNKTMHPAKTYTDEQAETVFNAVRNFMQQLAPLVV